MRAAAALIVLACCVVAMLWSQHCREARLNGHRVAENHESGDSGELLEQATSGRESDSTGQKGPELVGSPPPPRGRSEEQRNKRFGVGLELMGLSPPPRIASLGAVLRAESWTLTGLPNSLDESSRQNPHLVWTFPSSMSGPHLVVSIARSQVGPYDSRVLMPDSVRILEPGISQQGARIERVSAADAALLGDGVRVQPDGQSWSVVGSLGDWGTNVTDFCAFRVTGMEEVRLPATFTVWARYGAIDRAQRFRITPALQHVTVQRVGDVDGLATRNVVLGCSIAYMEGVRRARVEVLSSDGSFILRETRVDGEQFVRGIADTVENAPLEIEGEYGGDLSTLHFRLWVEDASGRAHSVEGGVQD